VSPGEQGRGVGQALMAGVTAAAAAGGVPRVQLGVDPENRRAIRFFELQGFERTSLHSGWFGDRAGADGDAAPRTWWGVMEKVLAAS
jgi:ribosomal protein S18 acetylase RimI-like enzyme